MSKTWIRYTTHWTGKRQKIISQETIHPDKKEEAILNDTICLVCTVLSACDPIFVYTNCSSWWVLSALKFHKKYLRIFCWYKGMILLSIKLLVYVLYTWLHLHDASHFCFMCRRNKLLLHIDSAYMRRWEQNWNNLAISGKMLCKIITNLC